MMRHFFEDSVLDIERRKLRQRGSDLDVSAQRDDGGVAAAWSGLVAIVTSSTCRRSNPGCVRGAALDCFRRRRSGYGGQVASLAMTVPEVIRSLAPIY